MDVHAPIVATAGNGSNDLFFEDPSVLFISSHQDGLFPMTGKLREAGAGDGEGYTINIPIPGTVSLERSFSLAAVDCRRWLQLLQAEVECGWDIPSQLPSVPRIGTDRQH